MEIRYEFDDNDNIISRRCNRCLIMKPLHLFHKDKTKRSGVVSICRECKRKRDFDIKASGYTCIVSDTERACSKCGEIKTISEFPLNGIRGRQKICKACKRAKYKAYRAIHLGKIRCRENKKTQVKAEGDYTTDEWNILLNLCENKCVFCGRENDSMTADHIIPVSVGGTNYIWNIQPACLSCNSSKGNRESIDRRPENAVRYFEGL